MKQVALCLILLTITASYAVSPQGQRPDIDTGIRIVDSGTAATRIAVPEFVVEGGDAKAASLALTFNQVLWDDLDYSGPLILASRSFYPAGAVRTATDIRREDWTKPGVDAAYIAFGTIQISGGEFSVNAQLHDLKTTSRLFGNRYTARDATDRTVRDIAHRFADSILESLGYGRGIAQTELAFVCDRGGNREICVMDYDGQNVTQITAVGLALTPSWSPDSKKIAYTSYRDGSSIEIVNRADLRRLPFPLLNGLNTTPTWAPDSGTATSPTVGKIAFASNSRDLRSGTRILIADEDGKNIRELTRSERSDFSPVWNPVTGKELVFASDRPPSVEGGTQLYVMDAEGTNVRLLGKAGGSTYNPAWSPDGTFIAFAWEQSGSGNRRDIWILNLRTGDMRQLTRDDGDNERPTWAPDMRHIAFSSNRSGSWQIYSMLADGTKTRALTRGGRNQGPAWSGHIRRQ
jgi:TolB protein